MKRTHSPVAALIGAALAVMLCAAVARGDGTPITSRGGSVTSVNAGSGLTGGGVAGAVTVNVGSGSGIAVTDDAVSIDPSYTQRRVSAKCIGSTAMQGVEQNGAVDCTAIGTGTVTSVGTSAPLSGGPITGAGSLSLLYGSGLTLSGGSLVVDPTVVLEIGAINGTTGDLAVYSGPNAIGNYGGSVCGTAHQAATSIGATGAVACSTFVDTAGTGLSLATSTLGLANTSVAAGSYTYASITVDAQGRLTAASSGTAPATGTGTSGTDTRWTSSSGLGNSSSTDDGTVKTVQGLARTTCSSTLTGIQTITIPAGCTYFEVAPATELDIVAIVAPLGARDVVIHNKTGSTGETYFFAGYTTGTTAANRFEGTFTGANGGWPLDPGSEILGHYSPADARWTLPIALSVGSLTSFGNLMTSGGYLASSVGIYSGGFADWYLSSVLDTAGCGYSVNSTATCYINALGYQEGVTQTRSLEVSDGTGHGTTHQLVLFDGVNHAVDLVNNADTFTSSLATLGTTTAIAGHVRTTSAAVTTSNISSCGGSPVVATGSTDTAGAITFGSGGTTSCTLTFNATYTTAPFCACSSSLAPTSGVFAGCSSTATTLTATAAASTGAEKFNYVCVGQ